MKTKKVLLAVGNELAEKKIQERLPKEFKVVGIAIYREQVLSLLEQQQNVDILLLRENISGSIDVLNMIFTIRNSYPNVRIILMTGQRDVGDAFLSSVISYGIFDIMIGHSTNVDNIISHFKKPGTFADVAKYQTIAPTGNIQYARQTTEANRKKVAATPRQPERKVNNVPTQSVSKEQGATSVQTGRKLPKPIKNPFETENGVKVTASSPKPKMESPIPVERVSVPAPEQESSSFNETVVKSDSEEMFVLGEDSFAHQSMEFVPSEEGREVEERVKEVNREEEVVEAPKRKAPIRPTQPVPVPMPSVERKKEEVPKRTPGQAKILSTDDMDRVKKPFVEKRRAVKDMNANPMILSVLGAKGGVGTTTVALNLALSLAQEKHKVLYVELNDKGLPFSFNYQLDNMTKGLEEALKKASKGNITEAFEHVHRMQDLKRGAKQTEFATIYNKYPNTFDYIAFSQSYFMSGGKTFEKDGLAQFLTTALLTEGYQYIVVDIGSNTDDELAHQVLKISRGVFSVITQDMASVAQNIHYLEAIHKKVIKFNKNLYFVINQYDGDGISNKALSRWIKDEISFKHEDVLAIPNFSKKILKANSEYLPLILASPTKEILNAYKTISNYARML